MAASRRSFSNNPTEAVDDGSRQLRVLVHSRALQGDGTIWWANLVGANPVQLAQNLDAPQGLAVDANYLYWANDGNSISGRP